MNSKQIQIIILNILTAVAFKLILYFNQLQHKLLGQIDFVFISLIFSISLIFFAKENKNTPFIANFKILGSVAVFTALGISSFNFIYYAYIDTTYFDILTQSRLLLMEQNNATAENIKAFKEQAHFIYTPQKQFFFSWIGYTFFNTFVAGLLAYIFKSK